MKNHQALRIKCIALLLFIVSLPSMLLSCYSSPPDESSEYVCFTDALDRECRIGKNPERVACLIGSFADVWTLAGGEVCAAPIDAWEDFGLVSDAVNIGGAHSPSTELLISSEPDLVIASASTASNVDMLELLDTLRIPVIYFDVDNFEDYLWMLDICTDITGRKDLYQKNGLEVKLGIDTVKAELSERGLSDGEGRILLLRVSPTTVKAKGSKGTILGEMLSDLGCINIADSDKTLLDNLSAEAIIRNEPHRMFVVTMGSNTQAAIAYIDRMLNENPAWATLEAVKEKRVHVMNKTLFNLKPNDRWDEAYEELYRILTDN